MTLFDAYKNYTPSEETVLAVMGDLKMKRKEQFSPGPWNQGAEVILCDQHNAGLTLCFLNTFKPERYAEGKANAHLIAAAPDLYEELLDRYTQHKCGCGHPACKSCKADASTEAVLARARGEQP